MGCPSFVLPHTKNTMPEYISLHAQVPDGVPCIAGNLQLFGELLREALHMIWAHELTSEPENSICGSNEACVPAGLFIYGYCFYYYIFRSDM